MRGTRQPQAETEEGDEEDWEPARKGSSKKPSQHGNGGGGEPIRLSVDGARNPDPRDDDCNDMYRKPKGKGNEQEGKPGRGTDNPTNDQMEQMVTTMARAMKTRAQKTAEAPPVY